MAANNRRASSLGGVASVQTGPFGSQLHASDYEMAGTPIITVEHLGDNEIVHDNLPLVGDADRQRLEKYSLQVGDIVFTRVGAIDRRAYVSRLEHGWLFSGRLLRVRPNPAVADSRFLSHLLGRHQTVQWIRNHAVGSTMACLNTAILSAVPVELPELPEQRRIAQILDTLDEAIRKTEELIAKLKQVKQGLLDDLLTRGIDDNGELRDPERHPEQFKDSALGRMPIDWHLALLHEVAEVRSGIAKNEGRALQHPVDVHYLRVANVQDGFLDLREMKTIRVPRADLDRYRVLPGDVLMNEGGDLDKLGRGSLWRGEYEPCVHQNHVFVVRCGAILLPEFLSVWTGAPRAKAYFMVAGKQTTNLASINKAQLSRLPVLLPSRAEQDRILSVLNSCEERLALEGVDLVKLHVLKQGLMEDLLTGRVRVSNLLSEAAA